MTPRYLVPEARFSAVTMIGIATSSGDRNAHIAAGHRSGLLLGTLAPGEAPHQRPARVEDRDREASKQFEPTPDSTSPL